MKNVFGINITDKNQEISPEKLDGAAFITDRLDQSGIDKLNELDTDIENQAKKHTLSPPLKALKGISYVIGMTCLIVIFRYDGGIDALFSSYPWLFILCGFGLICAGIFEIIERRMAKKFVNSAELKDSEKRAEALSQYSKQTLGIPENAYNVDVLATCYKIKTDKKTGQSKAVSKNTGFTHIPLAVFLYKNENTVCIADNTMVLSFPSDCFKKIVKHNVSVVLSAWNKDEPIKSEKYKKYKMGVNNLGGVVFKGYYSISIESDYGEFELLVPPYDIEPFSKLLGIEISNQEG